MQGLHEISLPPWPDGRQVAVHAALIVLLSNLRSMHQVWRQKTFLNDDQISRYSENVHKFAMAWQAFKWQGTIWVHWAIAHSGHLLRQHRSLYLFSSIPTEHKHKTFKLDVRHTFHGCSARRVRITKGLVHVVDNHALDVVLKIEGANAQARKKNRRHNARR